MTDMANINESIEQLTASLQELTEKKQHTVCGYETVAGEVPESELTVSTEVEKFVTDTRAYSDRTRNVSVGVY
jgi:hypothetical protein